MPVAPLALLLLAVDAALAVALGALLIRAARQRSDAATLDARLRAIRARLDRATEAIRAASVQSVSSDLPAPAERRPSGARRRTRRAASPPAPPARP